MKLELNGNEASLISAAINQTANTLLAKLQQAANEEMEERMKKNEKAHPQKAGPEE